MTVGPKKIEPTVFIIVKITPGSTGESAEMRSEN